MKQILNLTGSDLRLGDITRIIEDDKLQISVDDAALKRIQIARDVIERAVERDELVYGVNTGFGKMSSVRISRDQIKDLQRNLILSHATAVGEPLDPVVAKMIMVLRINALVKGNSGIRPLLVHTLMEMFNRGVVPVIPRQGSVGASGDLAPLAHLVLVVMGMGEAYHGSTLR